MGRSQKNDTNLLSGAGDRHTHTQPKAWLVSDLRRNLFKDRVVRTVDRSSFSEGFDGG